MKYILVVGILLSFFRVSAQDELEVLGNWTDTLVDSYSTWIHYNEVWGVAINDHEYAIVGSILGTHIVDITDPTKPEQAFFVEGNFSDKGVVHRDYHDHKGYLYAVCDEGNSNLQIIDMNFLPDSIAVVYDSDLLIQTSHNIFIDSTSELLYHCGGQNQGAVTIFDIRTPQEPVLIDSYKHFDGTLLSYAHDAFVRNDTAYLNCESAMVVVDFSDLDNPNTITVLDESEYPFNGYNHSGWLTDDGKTYVMADETNFKDIKVFDVGSLPDIDLHTTLNPGNEGVHMPHNPIIKGKYLYVSYYTNGIQIWDIEDPTNPIKTHYFIPENDPNTWGVYPFLPSGNIITSDFQNGLYIFSGIDGDVGVGVENEVEVLDIEVFPNPAADFITVNTTELQGETSFELYDIKGIVVQTGTIDSRANTKRIELSNELITGVYVLKVSSDKKQFQAQFVKK